MQTIDLKKSDWYTREETMQRLNLLERTLRTWVQLKRIRTKPDPVRHRQRLYSAADVEKFENAGPEPAKRAPSEPRQPRPQTNGVTVRKHQPDLAELFAALRVSMAPPAAPPPPPLWLTLEEAEQHIRLPRGFLLRLCQEGKLEAVKVPGWRIQRESLEAFGAPKAKRAHA